MARQNPIESFRLLVELSQMEVEDLTPPLERDVLAGRMRLHYLDWGTNGRRPILFLHGGALNAHTWDVVCLALRGDYHCIALDQRGHGDSEWSPEMDYSLEAYTSDIKAFVDALGWPSLTLIGQSLGGMNAMQFAATHGEMVEALVVVDTGPEVRIEGGRRIRDFVASTVEVDSVDEFVEMALAFNPLRDRRLLSLSAPHNLRQLPNGRWARKNDTRHWENATVEDLVARALRQSEDIPRIACPTLVVRGEMSDVFPPEAAESLARTLRNGQWISVAGAGHNVQGDNPRGLVEVIRTFLSQRGFER